MPEVDVNYLAVLVAAAAAFVLGGIWYAPPVFGNMWMKLIGKTKEDLKSGAAKAYVVAIIAALVTAYVLAHIIGFANADTVKEGAQAGAWVWLGFIATSMLMEAVFNGKPMKLYYIQAGYQLVSLLVMGMVIAGWE